MGLDFPELRATDEEMMREVLQKMPFTLDELRERSYIRLDIPSPHLPYRRGSQLLTPSGKIEIESERAVAAGLSLIPEYVPPYESEERNPELVRRFPLALISPPAHSFLNSTFVNVASLRRAAGKPTLEIHADDASSRGIAAGARVSIFNDRGAFTAEAVITDRVRPGVVSAPSVWWAKLTDDHTNANHTTSQAVTDIGGGATFYDNQVDVRPA
jgi:anaerobic selenocysteine-containing dehydrogenase